MSVKLDGNMHGGSVTKMQTDSFKENELLTGISILAVLSQIDRLDITKCLLIEPILSYNTVLKKLKSDRTHLVSVEEMILKEKIAFSDFNDRYYEHLLMSVNAMMLFQHMQLLNIENGIATLTNKRFDLGEKSLGTKAHARIKAAKKLAPILEKGSAKDLYLSLRIEL